MSNPPFLFRALAPALLFTIASCSSSSEAPADKTDPSEAAFCDSYAERMCALYSPCCAQIDHPLDQEKCLSVAKSQCGDIVDNARAQAHVFDATSANDCLQRIDQGVAACVETDASTRKLGETICENDVYRGSTPLGGPCMRDSDCARHPDGRTECDNHRPNASLTCVLPVTSKVDEPCLQFDDNFRFFVCERDLTCTGARRCARPLPEGAQCANGPERFECAAPYVCMTGICSKPPRVGEACEYVSTDVCGDAARCNTYTGICEALSEDGAICTESEECASRWCSQGTCRPALQQGDACDPAEWPDSGCSASFCDSQEHICKALLPNGTACTSDSQCDSQRCEGRCVPIKFLPTKACGL